MKTTQNTELIKYLKSHRGITQRRASRTLGIDRLSARVYELRNKHGYNIVTVMISVPTRYGKTQVAEYRLIEEVEA